MNVDEGDETTRIARRNHPPMDFPDDPPVEKENITLKDYFDFFRDFIMTDQKGRVSNAHLAFADQENLGEVAIAKKIHFLRVHVCRLGRRRFCLKLYH